LAATLRDERGREREKERARAWEREKERARETESERARESKRASEREREQESERASKRESERARERARERGREREAADRAVEASLLGSSEKHLLVAKVLFLQAYAPFIKSQLAARNVRQVDFC